MNDNKIIYLHERDNYAKVYYEEGVKVVNSIKSEIKKIASKHLFSIDGYLFSVRKELSLKYKIPIYFSSRLFLFCIKTKNEMFLVNYFSIYKILYQDNIVIVFNNGELLELSISKDKIVNQMKKVELILNYINNLL